MSTVLPFTHYQLHDIPNALRLLAEQIEAGKPGAARVLVVLELDGGGVDYRAFGGEPFTVAHAIGLLHVAQNRVAAS